MRGIKKIFNITLLFALLFGTIFSPLGFDFKTPEKAKASEPAWPEDMSDWKFRKKVHIDGTASSGAVENVMRLNVHYGNQQGDVTNDDIFLNKKSQTDFDDVRFTDVAGNPINYWRASTDNSELIQDDNNVGNDNIIVNTEPTDQNTGLHLGDMISSSSIDYDKDGDQDYGLFKTSDNGANWTRIYANSCSLAYIDSRGYIYIQPTVAGGVYRSIDGGQSFDPVLNTSTTPAFPSHGRVVWSSIDEDSNHNLYLGQYTDSTFDTRIFRSTDGGATFQLVYSYNDEYNSGNVCVHDGVNCQQHIHGLGYDSFNNRVWAGIDGSGTLLYCDLDDEDCSNTTDWQIADTGFVGDDYIDMVFDEDYQLFAAGAMSLSQDGNTIVKNDDQSGWHSVLRTYQTPQSMQKVGDNIYGFISAYTGSGSDYSQIVKSSDDGETWETICLEDRITDAEFGGHRVAFQSGRPKISEGVFDDEQILVGMNEGSYQPDSRFYVGGEHFQSTFFIKPGTIDLAGKDIYIYYGNNEATTEGSEEDIFSKNAGPSDGLVGYWKFDEGSGITTSDASGNGNDGSLRNTTGTLNGLSWDTSSDGVRVAGQNNEIVSGANEPTSLPGNRLSFTSGYVDLTAHKDDFSFTAEENQDFSIFAWFKTDHTGTYKTIVSKGYGGHVQYKLGISSAYTLQFYNSGDLDVANAVSSSSGKVNNGVWHFAGVYVSNIIAQDDIYPDYDGTDAGSTPGEEADACADVGGCQYATFYYEGKKFNTAKLVSPVISSFPSHPGDATKNDPPIKIGTEARGGTADYAVAPFVGDIDSVRIYNDGLTEEEIMSIYEGRDIPTEEPSFDGAANYEVISSSRSTLFKNVTNTIDVDTTTVTYGGEEPVAADEINMTISPDMGTLSVSVSEWNTGVGGDYSKEWVENGTDVSAASHVIGDLAPGTYYTVSTDGWTHTGMADENGELEFSYDNGYSEHTFTLVSYDITSLTEKTPVSTYTNDTTPSYIVTSDRAGAINMTGDCNTGQNLLGVGDNTITFEELSEGLHSNCTLKILDGNNVYSNILTISSFTVDTTAPTLTITAPSDGLSTGNSSVTITGSVSDINPGATITINGVSISSPSSFSATASLSIGSNIVTLVATDVAGNMTTRTITVTRQLPPQVNNLVEVVNANSGILDNSSTPTVTDNNVPAFSITDPNSNTNTLMSADSTPTFYTQYPTLSGHTEPYATVIISIDGTLVEVIADGNGDWQYKITDALSFGEHIVKITVKEKDTGTVLSENSYTFNVAEKPGTKADSQTTNNSDSNLWWLWIVGGIIIVTGVIIIVSIRRNKK